MDTKRVKLPHAVIVKAPGLLPMWYRLPELAEELADKRSPRDLSRAIHTWIDHGLPAKQDTRGHWWLDGRAVANWIEERRKKPPREKLGDDQAYCLREHRVVDLIAPVVRAINGKKILYTAVCPRCGGGISKGAKFNDQSG